MEGLATRTGRYRHVVFADAIDGGRRPVNLAPQVEAEIDTALDLDDGAFLRWLFERGGLDVRHYRVETLVRRLPACLRKLRLADVRQARMALGRNPALVQDALGTTLIGVTSFFRDGPVFDELANRVLPELLRKRNPLRVWSVGCSEGPELYSIAMLLCELGACNDVELLGTDCRPEATRAAARGIYPPSMLRDISPQRMAMHFERVQEQPSAKRLRACGQHDPLWQVKSSVRAMTRWRVADLITTIEPGPWDLILCRNTAMYLRCSTAAVLWESLLDSLAPGGYLVLGKAERPVGLANASLVGHYLYRRTD